MFSYGGVNMKTNRKVICFALIVVVLSLLIAGGVVFALFTSEKTLNTNVTSAKVDVYATVEDVVTKSPVQIEKDGANYTVVDGNYEERSDGYWNNGGSAIYNAHDSTLSIDAISPGDIVTFNVKITNKSTIAVQYRTVIKLVTENQSSSNTFFGELKIVVGGQSLGDQQTEVSSQYKLLPKNDAGTSTDVKTAVSIELPADATLQGGTCALVVIVEAVQGNAKTTVTQTTVSSVSADATKEEKTEALNEILKEITADSPVVVNLPATEEDKPFVLTAGAAGSNPNEQKDITFAGTKDTVLELGGATTSSEGQLSYQDNTNLTFSGITVNASNADGLCARGGDVLFIGCRIVGEFGKTIANSFTFINCEFVQADTGHSLGMVGYGCKDVVVEDCTFTGYHGYAIKIYSEGNTPVNLTVKNCKFTTQQKDSTNNYKPAIFIDHIIANLKYNISIKGCTFNGFTNMPVRAENKWAERQLMFVYKNADNQYVFGYQTGASSGGYYKPLTTNDLSVKVDGVEVFDGSIIGQE